MRQIVLDTETTGFETSLGHRIIEIGALEVVNRELTGRTFHEYINPQRQIDLESIEVHGITNEDLRDKPVFADLVDRFVEFVDGAELIAHNAPFDVGFLDYELELLDHRCRVSSLCRVTDSLALARKMHPGARNSLDALCKRYDVSNAHRDLHGALLDAELLALVYLRMTGGQIAMRLQVDAAMATPDKLDLDPALLPIVQVTAADEVAHAHRLRAIDDSSGGECVWLRSA